MKLTTRLAALYEMHDKVEDALRIAERAGIKRQELWAYHDMLEREIIRTETKLPPEVVEEMVA
jgi:hypothetical protein